MPKIGLRNIKTAIAVMLSLAIYPTIILVSYLFTKDFKLSFEIGSKAYTPFFACLAAAYSIGNNKAKSLEQAKTRLVASVIGGLCGILVVFIYRDLFKLGWAFAFVNAFGAPVNGYVGAFDSKFVLSFIVPMILTGFTVCLVIWLCNLLKHKECAFISVLTLTAVMTSLGTDPVLYGFNRILSTAIGLLLGLFVNLSFTVPVRSKNNMYVVSLDGIFIDDEHYIDGYNEFKINNLIYRNADLVFYSTRTPVTFIPILENVNYDKPVVCLSGAALYDFKKKEYLYVENIDIETTIRLNDLFKTMNISPFVNLVDDNVLYTYNLDLNNEGEVAYAKNRKNSAYGCYVSGHYPLSKDVCYFMVIDSHDKINDLIDTIKEQKYYDKIMLQAYDCYEITGEENLSGYKYLKIYSAKVKENNALKKFNEHNKKIIACGCHKYDKALFEFSDYSFTNTKAPNELKDVSNKVLLDESDERIFKEIGRMSSSSR